MTGNSPLSLYVHLPFCTRKCHYCHFYVLLDKELHKQQLHEALSLEWEQKAPLILGRPIATLYFGGGTPALFGTARIGAFIERATCLPVCDDFEVTVEVNPENATPDLLRDLRACGVNRLSIGIQSLADEQLSLLGRVHSAQRAIDAVESASAAGFDNLSVDLMYDLPGQSERQWQDSIERAASLPIAHLSLYNLTIEPHTLFYKARASLEGLLPPPEASARMYATARDLLPRAGLHQYEISAFAREGYASRHNCGYWTGRDFLGFGPSAFSFFAGNRTRNVANLSRYAKALQAGASPCDLDDRLDADARRRELLAVQLRLLQGVHLPSFEKERGPLSAECRRSIANCQELGLLRQTEEILALTESGIFFYDSVAAELI